MELFVKHFDELSTHELHDILKLRCDVFVVEQECFYPDVDGFDPESIHVFYLDDDGSLAAYTRVMRKPDEEGVVKLGRVIAAKRGAGLGRAVMEEAMKAAVRCFGATSAYLEGQVRAKGFYEKLGFAVCSDEFDEAGIPHVQMRRSLAGIEG